MTAPKYTGTIITAFDIILNMVEMVPVYDLLSAKHYKTDTSWASYTEIRVSQ